MNTIEQYPLPDDLYDSKDWRDGSYAERVEWLHTMYENVKHTLDAYVAQQQEFECPRCGHCCPTQRKPWLGLTPEDFKGMDIENAFECGAWWADVTLQEKNEQLYTTPQRKPWVGLTKDDIQGLLGNQNPITAEVNLCRAVESFLEEKNV